MPDLKRSAHATPARGLFASLKRRLQSHPLGTIAVDLKAFLVSTARDLNGVDRKVITLKPAGPRRGEALLCYDNSAFVTKPGSPVPNDHTNRWEARQIAQSLLDLGYRVDVIGENNEYFLPARRYSIFIGNRINFDRIVASLNADCLRILHVDTAHWLFHNAAQHRRLLELQQRRGFTLPTRRLLKPNTAIEHADCATVLGNDFTISTYSYAGKPMYRIPVSTPVLYPWPQDKDFETNRSHFLWFGSHGFVHKGLDLVLEAFREMPDYHLTVCGPLHKEADFESAFAKELYYTPNIHTAGWVDVAGSSFIEIAKRCVAVVYPSCSEGGGASAIGCMHAGLIPVVSTEASVDTNESFGLLLKQSSIHEIKTAVKTISRLPARELQAMAHAAWEFARAHHTRERFAEEYRKTLSVILNSSHAGNARCQKEAFSGGLDPAMNCP